MPSPARAATTPPATGLTLRSYQLEALDAVVEAEARGCRRQIVQMATGLGKTVVFTEQIRRRGDRGIVLVHRDELVRQAVEKLAMVMPGVPVGVVKAEQDYHGAQVVVASVQTLSRETRLQRIVPDFSTIVVDECHHMAADSYQRVLQYLAPDENRWSLVLGVTATPERSDGLPLEGFEIVYRKSILDGIREGYLADLKAVQVRLRADFRRLHQRAGDFIDSEVEALMLEAGAPEHAARAYREQADGRKAILFTSTVRLAHEMAAAFKASGVRAEAIDAGTPLDVRRAVLARLRSGDVQVVSNCGILVEGFDEPSVDCILMARPTRSRLLFMQMLGRVTRLFPGKTDGLVLDLVGSFDRHDLMTVAVALQLKSKHLGKGILHVLDEQEREEQAAQAAQAGALVAQRVDLFRAHPVLPRKDVHWVKVAGGRFVVSLGDESLLMVPTVDAMWRVIRRSRHGVERVLADGLSLEYAQGVAEDYARTTAGASVLVNTDAPWRSAPASEKQRAVLERYRIPHPPTITKGEAADLLTAKFAGGPAR